jgi:hypothetical protein
MMAGTTFQRMMREKFDDDDEKINILKQVSRFQIILIIIDISYI